MSSAEAGVSSTYFVAAAIAMIRRAVDSNRRGAGRVCPGDVGTTQTGALRDAATRHWAHRGLAWVGSSC